MNRLTYLLVLPFLLVPSCSSKNRLDDHTLVIGCSPTPHAEILKAAKPLFQKKGYRLDIKVLQDYVTPNTLLDSGDLDANYFQHVPYLEDFNEKNHTDLSWIVKVHFEPMGIYSAKHGNLSKVNPRIAIPNDVSNGDRARDLLSIHGMSGQIIEVEAQALPSILSDVDYACINGNYALSAGILDKCLVTESKDSEISRTNANVVAVKTSSLDYEWVDVIKEVMTSETVANFITTTYGSSVIPVF